MKTKILSLSCESWDATAFYRGLVPMDTMGKQVECLDIHTPGPGGLELNEQLMMGYDAVFIQRPAKPIHEEISTLAKRVGVPLWVDYDDDIFSMQPDNPAKQILENSGVVRSATFCLQTANVVTCTTRALKTSLTRFNPNVVVIPNAWDDMHIGTSRRAPGEPTGKKKVVAWRGASAHFCDLYEVVGPPKEIAERHGGWRWAFVGENFHLFTKQMPPGSWLHFQWQSSMVSYLEKFKNIVQPDLLIVPLVDCLFNHAKSNVAWLEGSYAGAACLVPDFPEWQVPGVIHYSSPADFRVQLEKCLSGQYDLTALAAESWEYITKNRFLTQINQQRLDVIKSLPIKRPKPLVWE